MDINRMIWNLLWCPKLLEIKTDKSELCALYVPVDAKYMAYKA